MICLSVITIYMKKGFLAFVCMTWAMLAAGQHIVQVLVKGKGGEPLASASVSVTGLDRAGASDSLGMATLRDLPAGRWILAVSHVGYERRELEVAVPLVSPGPVVVLMEVLEKEEQEVVVTSTRSNRSIRNIPTRVEVISGEELEEKGNMRPGDIRMMLNESTGIQTQQVSATSANASIRIQGLDGRYTQLLKDGFPLYAGFSGGLGLLQTPPLDLRQVEIIKGASSTLYGGGAIAGMINLVSKAPTPDRDLRFLVNGTSAGGLDVDGFYGQRWKKWGVTVYGGRSSNAAYNPSGAVPFSAIPRFDRYVFNPKLFLYFSERTRLSVGVSLGWENRIGGDMTYLQRKGDSTHSYFERNKSQRFSAQLSLEHRVSDRSSLTVKNSVGSFDRTITIPGYVFDGRQWSSYSEVAYSTHQDRMDWVAGLNVYTDGFREHRTDTFPRRNYQQNTLGGFVQHTWTINEWLQTEAGLRGDYVVDYGWAVLPRVSALFKWSPAWTSRIGGGMGYKTPTIFTEETERIQYQGVLPVSSNSNRLERSHGVNADVNYRTSWLDGRLSLSVNQLFFYTRINDPLVLDTLAGPKYRLTNSSGYLQSKGFETNVKLGYGDFKLYIGYTFTDAHLDENGVIRENPLTVRHRLNNVLVYEKADKWKLGLEGYFYSTEPLNDGTTGKSFWTFGFMAEKICKWGSLFINFENFTDTRQTRFDRIYTGTVTQPVFRDIYAPLDGRVVNGGVKFRL
jgi:outer membrane receptor protein involved in Fe transport